MMNTSVTQTESTLLLLTLLEQQLKMNEMSPLSLPIHAAAVLDTIQRIRHAVVVNLLAMIYYVAAMFHIKVTNSNVAEMEIWSQSTRAARMSHNL
jgi:hypothetical protein